MFREEDHPRDKGGQFAEKGGGEKGKLADAIKQYSDDPARDLVAAGLPSGEKNASAGDDKQKRKIQSQVFDKISTVRRRLETHGRAMITVFDNSYRYTVRLYGPDDDYEYEIVDMEEIE